MVAVVMIILSTATAFAEAGEVMLSASVGTQLTQFSTEQSVQSTLEVAPILSIAAAFAVTDYWQVGGQLGGGVTATGSRTPQGVVHGLALVRYVIDALRWVPMLEVGVGVRARAGEAEVDRTHTGPSAEFTAHAGFGLEYRPARVWSVGGVFRYHLVPTQLPQVTGPFEVTLGVTWYLDDGP